MDIVVEEDDEHFQKTISLAAMWQECSNRGQRIYEQIEGKLLCNIACESVSVDPSIIMNLRNFAVWEMFQEIDIFNFI